ncbi:MAG TPA: molybdopterin-dependent oxidoreductase [Acidimicrobiales bacterium]|jgi:anaerobic selenocysteine-containing dehydrogenase|nr:molybdopterin-dependent oxidoreductase [Acidimicrobiales bacterium]
MTITKTSTCRLCTALCPIVVTIEDGRAVEVHGDREAPLYEGYTCPKGRALPEIHANPNRLLHSLRRRPDGSHEQIGSQEAVDEIADRLRDVVDRHGPSAVAIYIGTAASFYPALGTVAAALITALGSKMIFSAASIDQPGTRIADAFHGMWLGGRTSFDECDAFLFAGTNPVISKQFLAENPAKRLARAVERGTKVIVLDPRRTETARRAHVHLQVRPGQDAVVMAGLIHVILHERLVDEDFIAKHVDGVEALRAAVAPFTPEFVARQADIPVQDLVDAARTLGTARRGGAGGGTGISMTSCTSVVSYLLLCLMSLRGWWAREGDRIERPNVLMPPNHAKAQARRPYEAMGRHKMRVRGLQQNIGGLPTAALAEEILLSGDGQIRALFNVGGSPMMAWPDQRKTREALESLELFVTTDVEYSPTARMADYVVATKMTLETPSMTQVTEYIKYFHPGYGFCAPYAQYTPALVDPPAGADLIEDWQLYYRVAQRLGLSLNVVNVFGRVGAHLEAPIDVVPIDMEHEPTTDDLYEIMCRGSHVPLDEVKRHPHGHVFEDLLDMKVGPSDADCEDRLDVGNADMLAELGEIRDRATTTNADDDRPFLFVPRRENRVINSTGRTLPGLMRGRSYNPAFMHPDDLARLGVAAGDEVEIRSEYDTITGVAQADADLRPGVVSMSHGFGGIPGEHEDPLVDGANTNRLVRTDVEFDRYTGIPRMGALPVAVRASNTP